MIIPFAGDAAAVEQLVGAFASLRLTTGDEVIVADNSPAGTLAGHPLPEGWQAVPARGEGSPARARNAGALAARHEWLLFVDSDCLPPPDLVERLFARPIAERCGIVAGGVIDARGQRSLAARHAATRRVLSQETTLAHSFLPYALTANLLVRRALWRELGGFLDGIYNAEDVDFCWRAQRRGWTLDARLDAAVEHVHRDSLRALLRQHAQQRASAVWVHRRWPEAARPPIGLLRRVARSLVAVPVFAFTGRIDRARLQAVDLLVAAALVRGGWMSNRARPRPRPSSTRRPILMFCDRFPVVSETFIVNEARALIELGHDVEVIAGRRPEIPRADVHDVPVRFLEDDTVLQQTGALVRLVLRHPLRCVADRLAHRRWAANEPIASLRELAPVIRELERRDGSLPHAHFAMGAALNAMRAGHIAGRPWTLTAHAFDIYKTPANLEEKVRDAALVTSGCEYTVRDLRAIAGPERAERVHEIVMGVDAREFRRATPHPAGGRVVAIGRMVEKKGFVHLVRAVAEPDLAAVLDELVIVGDGDLFDELRGEVERLGVGNQVRLPGAQSPAEIRAVLEQADVLAMPCVVAADGDRDSMPVVVKEAMAMEIPVVVSDEVGLPELVRPEFGRVVPPADAPALAAALTELLALTPEQRAAMGRAARAHVVAHADVRAETRKLSELIERAAAAAGM